jgi:hypothetical protein
MGTKGSMTYKKLLKGLRGRAYLRVDVSDAFSLLRVEALVHLGISKVSFS